MHLSRCCVVCAMQGFVNVKWHNMTVSAEGVEKLGQKYWDNILSEASPLLLLGCASCATHPRLRTCTCVCRDQPDAVH